MIQKFHLIEFVAVENVPSPGKHGKMKWPDPSGQKGLIGGWLKKTTGIRWIENAPPGSRHLEEEIWVDQSIEFPERKFRQPPTEQLLIV